MRHGLGLSSPGSDREPDSAVITAPRFGNGRGEHRFVVSRSAPIAATATLAWTDRPGGSCPTAGLQTVSGRRPRPPATVRRCRRAYRPVRMLPRQRTQIREHQEFMQRTSRSTVVKPAQRGSAEGGHSVNKAGVPVGGALPRLGLVCGAASTTAMFNSEPIR